MEMPPKIQDGIMIAQGYLEYEAFEIVVVNGTTYKREGILRVYDEGEDKIRYQYIYPVGDKTVQYGIIESPDGLEVIFTSSADIMGGCLDEDSENPGQYVWYWGGPSEAYRDPEQSNEVRYDDTTGQWTFSMRLQQTMDAFVFAGIRTSPFSILF